MFYKPSSFNRKALQSLLGASVKWPFSCFEFNNYPNFLFVFYF